MCSQFELYLSYVIVEIVRCRCCCLLFSPSRFSSYRIGVALKRAFFAERRRLALLGARVLGDGLRTLADGVLGELSGQQEADGRLYLATGDRRTTVVVGETRRLGGDALEDVVDEAVHDGHGLAADARVGMDLLQHLVDVDGIALPSPPLALLVAGTHCLGLARGLLRTLASWFRRHDNLSFFLVRLLYCK